MVPRVVFRTNALGRGGISGHCIEVDEPVGLTRCTNPPIHGRPNRVFRGRRVGSGATDRSESADKDLHAPRPSAGDYLAIAGDKIIRRDFGVASEWTDASHSDVIYSFKQD